MRRAAREEGIALVTVIVLVTMMLIMGFAMLAVVDTQTAQTRTERRSETAFNVAEAALNAQAFLLGRNWPQTAAQMPNPGAPATPCSSQTMDGTLDKPVATANLSLRDQVQSIMAQTFEQSTSGAHWWVTTCAEGGRDAWDQSLLSGNAFDTSTSTGVRRMWVRAEGHVGDRRRAVVALVQAGQQPVFPDNLAVVTGKFGADLRTTTGQALGGSAGALLEKLTGSASHPVIEGPIGLRCTLLDQTALLGCLSALFKTTTGLGQPLNKLLQANDFVDFEDDAAISAQQLTALRQQAQGTSTYYPKTDGGAGTVANGAPCLPAASAGKVVFIEQVGDGTGQCVLDTTGNVSAKALVVGSGSVLVKGTGTFTGVLYALHRTALPADDVRVEGPAKVVGAVFVDDNPDLGSNRHGSLLTVPPMINLQTALNSIVAGLPLCKVPIVGPVTCAIVSNTSATVDTILSTLGISATVLATAILPQLDPSTPTITYNANVVHAVTTFGDSAVVSGTFRQVAPSY
jgi:Tfp pilus assembly protein PilX